MMTFVKSFEKLLLRRDSKGYYILESKRKNKKIRLEEYFENWYKQISPSRWGFDNIPFLEEATKQGLLAKVGFINYDKTREWDYLKEVGLNAKDVVLTIDTSSDFVYYVYLVNPRVLLKVKS